MTAKAAGVRIAPFGKFDHVTDWVFDLDVQDEDLEHQENFDYVYDWSSVVSNRLQLRFDDERFCRWASVNRKTPC